jgi:hypothetical protein
VDDEPRSADAGILRQERDQSRLLSDLPARRCRAAVPKISGGLEGSRLAQKAEHRLLLDRLCRRTDEKAIENALFRASRAYEGFF